MFELEYHEVFYTQKCNDNDYLVKVSGLPKGSTLPTKYLPAAEIVNLIDKQTDSFVTAMRFDDWLFVVKKITIDIAKQSITISIKPIEA